MSEGNMLKQVLVSLITCPGKKVHKSLFYDEDESTNILLCDLNVNRTVDRQALHGFISGYIKGVS